MAYDYACKVFGAAKVDEVRRMRYKKENALRFFFRNRADFVHKKLLELRVKVKFRLVKDKTAFFYAVQRYEKGDYFF